MNLRTLLTPASRSLLRLSLLAILISVTLSACATDDSAMNEAPKKNSSLKPDDFPAVIYPANNPENAAVAELGKHLFYDKRMSVDNSVSCASCHKIEHGFADAGQTTSPGAFGQRGRRNAPGLANIAYNDVQLWDGKFKTLEDQVIGPFLDQHEFALDTAEVVRRILAIPEYAELFKKAFGDVEITFELIRLAIANFERTLFSGFSSYDEWARGNGSAMTPEAVRGLALFLSKEINCVGCHSGINFTDYLFHSTGLERFYSDQGRELITGNSDDNGKFKTPSLRNVALTGPYMHNGRFTDLMQVMRHYNEGGENNETQDPLIKKLHLSETQMQEIVAFLNALTDKQFTQHAAFKDPWKN